jgi:DNA-binding transcriptional LysR family regulator
MRADRLSIGCEAAAEMAVVGRALARLAQSQPTMRVALHVLAADEMARALRAGDMQAAVVALPVSIADEDVAVDVVASVPLCVAVRRRPSDRGPPSGVLAAPRRGAVRPVCPRRLARPFRHRRRDLPARRLTMKARHHATELQAALTLVAAGLGVTVMPRGWQPPRALGLTCRPLRPPAVAITFGVAYRRDARTPAVERFIEAARATAPTAQVASSRGRPAVEEAS